MEMDLEADGGVHIHRETTSELLTGDRVGIQTRGEQGWLEVGAVVVGGRVANTALSDDLRRSGLRARTYTIGDAVRARDLYAAGQEAAEVAEMIGSGSGMPGFSYAPGQPAASG